MFAFSAMSMPATAPLATVAQIRTVIRNDFLFPNQEVATNEFIEIKADGGVYVTTTYLKGKDVYLRATHPLAYSKADILRLQKSVSQLNPKLPLVEDVEGEIACDGNSIHYSVFIDGVETILYERNTFSPHRFRRGRSKLEMAVIRVLQDLLVSYHNTLATKK